MNTRFSFVLFVIVIAVIATACAPAIDSSAPLVPAAPSADNETSALMPVTGESASTVARDAQESRLWSGEIFLSDNNGPDLKLNNNIHIDQQTTAECMSEDSQPRRQGGCVE